MTKNEINNLSGAAALDAISTEELAAYERLLSESEEARSEAIELADTAVILGLAVQPIEPPAGMRATLLAQIATMPQNGVVPVEAVPTARTMDAAPLRSVGGSKSAPADSAPATASATTPAERKAEQRWFRRPALAIASVAAAVAIIAGGVSVVTNFGADQNPSVSASALEQLTLASDKQEIVTDIEGGGSATLMYSEKLGSSAISMDGTGDLSLDAVYQLWYIGDDGPRSAGVMPSDAEGGSWQLLEGEMHAGDVVGVTVEPKGGSEQPTTSPIVVIAS